MLRTNFPLLQINFPKEEEMARIRRENPLLWMDALRLSNLAKRLKESSLREREKLLTNMLKKQLGTRPGTTNLHLLNESIQGAVSLFKDLTRWIPRRYSESFSSEGIIAFSSDYITLLLNWQEFEAKAREGDELSEIREFNARRLLYLAMLLLQIRLIYSSNDQAEDCTNITRYLEEVYFSSQLEDRVVISWHDPKNKERVKKWCFAGEKEPDKIQGLIKKETYLKCRILNCEGKEYPIYFDSRRKEDTEKLRKMLQKNIPDAQFANTDEYGLRFVFFSKEAQEAGLKKLCLELWPLPFMTWKTSDNTAGQRGGMGRNKHSNHKFKALKFKTASFGFWPEVMVQQIEDYLNHKCSKGPESHPCYRATQLRKEVFPLLFPRQLYNVDWENKEVIRLMETIALSGID